MPERVDARDVLDANALIKHPVNGTVLGYFQRTGPNSWDDYQFVRDDQGELAVLPGLEIQLERQGTDFRMRREGRVIRVRWSPGPDDPEELPGQTRSEQRQYFVHKYLQDYDEAPALGAAAVIVRKLSEPQ